MSKRTFFQCDKCLYQLERDAMPADWREASITQPTQRILEAATVKMWCPDCWRGISEPYAQVAKP
jgi:hypothetical protein